MSKVEEARAALVVAELEQELIAAKEAGDTDSDDYRDLKVRLREARQAHREQRSGQPTEPGDAVVSPKPARAKAEVKK